MGPWLITRSLEQSASGQCRTGGAAQGAPAIDTNCCWALAMLANATATPAMTSGLTTGTDTVIRIGFLLSEPAGGPRYPTQTRHRPA